MQCIHTIPRHISTWVRLSLQPENTVIAPVPEYVVTSTMNRSQLVPKTEADMLSYNH